MNRRLNYVKDCQKNTERHALDDESNDTSSAQSQIDAESDLESLRKMVIRDCNITEAVEKLNSTRKLRKELMVSKEVDVRQKFPFFLTNPQLVGISLIVLHFYSIW